MRQALKYLAVWLAVIVGVAAVLARYPPLIGLMRLDRQEYFMLLVTVGLALWVFTCGLCALLFPGLRALGLRGPPRLLEQRAVRNIILGINGAASLCALYARYVETHWLHIRHVEIPVQGITQPMKLVHLSDTHVDPRFNHLEEVVGTINDLAPDLVFFTGDSLNESDQLSRFKHALGNIRATHGKFAVRGNWDEWYWTHLDLFRDTGFLELTGIWITLNVSGTTVHVGGHGYKDAAKWDPIKGTLPVQPGVRIFLFHTPDFVEDAARDGMDLYLSGHTHGGQVALPFYGALVTLARNGKRFERGIYQVDGTWVNVNPGLGVEAAFPLRFGVRPEVTVMHLLPGT